MKHTHPLAAAVATMLLIGASGEWLARPGSRVSAIQPGQPAPGPIAVRNERPRAGRDRAGVQTGSARLPHMI